MKKIAVLFLAGLLTGIALYGQALLNLAEKNKIGSLNENKDTNFVDLTSGLVAFYPFWGNTKDESGNGHDGTAFGATLVEGFCEPTQGAYAFTGGNNTLSFSGTQLSDPYLTVCLRIKITDAARDTVFLSTSSALKILLRIVDRRYRVELTIGSHKIILTDENGIFKIDPQNPRFNFLVLSYDGAQVNFSINGQDIDHQNLDRRILPVFPITIKNDIVYSFYGVIDDIRIYNRLLSEREIWLIRTDIYFTSPTVTNDSVNHIGSDSATLYTTVKSNASGKDIYHYRVYWDTQPNPDKNTSQFIDCWTSSNMITHLSGLKPNKTYYVTTDYMKECGGGGSNIISFTTLPDTQLGSVTDVEGNVYKTVQIGYQTWMAENLRTSRYNNGISIPQIEDKVTWASLSTPAFCWNNNDLVNYGKTYGALYNWYTVNEGNICPSGWHTPTDAELYQLREYLGGADIAGGKLKEMGTAHWNEPNKGATNESRFTALPGGLRDQSGDFRFLGEQGNFWTSTELNSQIASIWGQNCFGPTLADAGNDKKVGAAVRCLMDSSSSSMEADLQKGLVAYYPFNGNANDESGKNHHGIVNGAILTNDRFGNSNSAYEFNAINNYIEIADNPDINFGKSINFTITFWFKLVTYEPQGDYGILTKGTQTSDVYGFDLPFGENAAVRFIMGKENGAAFLYRDYPSVDDGQWHFIAGTAIRNSNTMKLYQDGIKINELTTDVLKI